MTAILVVDDEPAVCKAIGMMLQGAGYSVALAPNGAAAIEAIRSCEVCFGAALIDLSLPRIDGVPVVEALANAAQELPLIVMSGMIWDNSGLERVLWIAKPFKTRALLEIVGDAVAANPDLSTGKPAQARADATGNRYHLT